MHLKVSFAIALLTSSMAATAESFAIARSPVYRCQPGDLSPANQYTCCVLQAGFIELSDTNELHLKSDPQMCTNPILNDLRFTLKTVTKYGLRVYVLASPQIEQTPFASTRGRPTEMWLNLSTYFELPQFSTPYDGSRLSVLQGSAGVDEYQMPGLADRTFGGDYRSVAAWVRQSQQVVRSSTVTEACPPHVSYPECRYLIETIEELWQHSLDGRTERRRVERSTYLGWPGE